jgi:hypothetical protein
VSIGQQLPLLNEDTGVKYSHQNGPREIGESKTWLENEMSEGIDVQHPTLTNGSKPVVTGMDASKNHGQDSKRLVV